jgi:hypothetical protein
MPKRGRTRIKIVFLSLAIASGALSSCAVPRSKESERADRSADGQPAPPRMRLEVDGAVLEQMFVDRLTAMAVDAKIMRSCRYATPIFLMSGDLAMRSNEDPSPFRVRDPAGDFNHYMASEETCRCVIAWGTLPRSVEPRAAVEVAWDRESSMTGWYVCDDEMPVLAQSIFHELPPFCWANGALVSTLIPGLAAEMLTDAVVKGGFIFTPVIGSHEYKAIEILPSLMEFAIRTKGFGVMPLGRRY